MGFLKKEWKERIAEFPGRRKLTKTSVDDVYDVTRFEGEIHQNGDGFTSDNMNDLESRIYDGIDSAEQFYGPRDNFPAQGKTGKMYVDDTISPALMYIWNGSSYVPAGGTGGGSGDDTFDVSFTLLAEGWAGSSAPYAQTASIPGMTSGKAVVYALVSKSAQPTAEEQEDYQLISGLSQNTDSVTFYADAIPAGDMVIRAFCGAGTEETADLSVIAAPFYAQKDYTTGERCINEGKLWKFTADKPAGAWDSTKVESTTVDAELAELRGKVDELNSRADALEYVHGFGDSPYTALGNYGITFGNYCRFAQTGNIVWAAVEFTNTAEIPSWIPFIEMPLYASHESMTFLLDDPVRKVYASGNNITSVNPIPTGTHQFLAVITILKS